MDDKDDKGSKERFQPTTCSPAAMPTKRFWSPPPMPPRPSPVIPKTELELKLLKLWATNHDNSRGFENDSEFYPWNYPESPQESVPASPETAIKHMESAKPSPTCSGKSSPEIPLKQLSIRTSMPTRDTPPPPSPPPPPPPSPVEMDAPKCEMTENQGYRPYIVRFARPYPSSPPTMVTCTPLYQVVYEADPPAQGASSMPKKLPGTVEQRPGYQPKSSPAAAPSLSLPKKPPPPVDREALRLPHRQTPYEPPHVQVGDTYYPNHNYPSLPPGVSYWTLHQQMPRQVPMGQMGHYTYGPYAYPNYSPQRPMGPANYAGPHLGHSGLSPTYPPGPAYYAQPALHGPSSLPPPILRPVPSRDNAMVRIDKSSPRGYHIHSYAKDPRHQKPSQSKY